MKNLKIGRKLLVTFGVIVVLFSGTVIMSNLSLSSTQKNFDNFYHESFQAASIAARLDADISVVGENLGYAVMSDDAAKTADYIAAAEESLESMREDIALLKKTFQGDPALVDKFEAALTNVKSQREQVFQLALENKVDQASALYFSQVQPGFVEAQGCLNQVKEFTSEESESAFRTSSKIAVSTKILLSAISLIAIIVTVLLAVYITKALTRPIKELEVVSEKMARGDFDISILYESRDELGSLSDSMRHFTNIVKTIIEDLSGGLSAISTGDFSADSKALELYVGEFEHLSTSMYAILNRLSDTLSQINQSADQVASSSGQVSSTSQALSQSAAQQASSVEELAATINEISAQVKETAANAATARSQTDQSDEEVDSCNRQMQEMIAAMNEISAKSNEIGKIIKTIEDIAFQTNILALNAAVEAARAGSAGKGFAVVADEVRSLASKSAEASNNTAVLIEGSIAAIEKGTLIANETAQSLVRVVESSQTVAKTVDKIAIAADQEASYISQVTQGIEQISGVVQNNSATAEESASASEELSGQAVMLKELVGQFKLRKKAETVKADTDHRESGINRKQTETGASDKY